MVQCVSIAHLSPVVHNLSSWEWILLRILGLSLEKSIDVSRLLPTNLATSEMMGILSQIFFSNDWGFTSPEKQGWLSFTGVNWAKEELFQSHTFSTHQICRPNLTVDKVTLKQASPTMEFTHPALRKARSLLQRTSLIQKRITKHFRHWWGPKGLCFATFKWDLFCFSRPQMTTGSKQVMIILSALFLEKKKNFLFNRVLHWSVQNLSIINP